MRIKFMPVELILYYRSNCHLCEQMLAELHANYAGNLRITMVDVDSDPALRNQYNTKVPVLACGNTVICQGGLDKSKLEDYLAHFKT